MSGRRLAGAVDIGTSTVRTAIVDAEKGTTIARVTIPNPQNEFGHDVVTRIRAAMSSHSTAHRLVRLLRDCVVSSLRSGLHAIGARLADLTEIVVVGNTVMRQFVLGEIPFALLEPPYDIDDRSSRIVEGREVSPLLTCGVYVPPVVHSFVGPDALASLISSGLYQRSSTSMLFDVGVNTEVMLFHSGELWATSAPSGPAFEESTLECGVPASAGAIDGVQVDSGQGVFAVHTVGDAPPMGICGSGAISLLAELKRVGAIDEMGSLSRQHPLVDATGLPVRVVILDGSANTVGGTPAPNVYLSQVDVRTLLQSKAAICAAAHVLLIESSVPTDEVSLIVITGAFGVSLDISAARAVGLIPDIVNAAYTLFPEGALKGAVQMILDPRTRDLAVSLAESARYVELMDNPLFDETMASAQRVRPFP